MVAVADGAMDRAAPQNCHKSTSQCSPVLMHRTTIRIVNRIEEFRRVAMKVEAFGIENNLPRGIINDLNVALDEILNNVVSYAYDDARKHWIGICLMFNGTAVTAVVRDDGAPFDPLEVPPPPLDRDLKHRRVGGIGIHFVRNLMDECRYSRQNGCNVLTITRRVG